MNPIMMELLARERSQRMEQEIKARQLLKNIKGDQPARKKIAHILKKLRSVLYLSRGIKTHHKASTKVVKALD